MGFEPTRAEHNGLAVHRLNHSATLSPYDLHFQNTHHLLRLTFTSHFSIFISQETICKTFTLKPPLSLLPSTMLALITCTTELPQNILSSLVVRVKFQRLTQKCKFATRKILRKESNKLSNVILWFIAVGSWCARERDVSTILMPRTSSW